MNTVTLENVVVGQEYVAFYCSAPLRCNSKNNPSHPYRVIITKVGRKVIHTDAGVKVSADGFIQLMKIEDAKAFYQKSLENAKPASRTPEFIAQCVASL